MSYFGELQAAGRSPKVCHFLILCLLSYIFIDYVLHHSGTSSCVDLVFDASDAKVAKSDKESVADSAQEDPICGSVIGHLNSGQEPPVAKAWSQMKWIGAPAKCRVKGQLIEALDPRNNFRRGFALKFTNDVEDKTMILPWLYGAKVDLNKRARRVYLDLGANSFRTSVTWFSTMYPCDFTEIHAFEVSPQLFQIPSPGFNEETNWVSENSHATRVKTAPGVPNWMLDRIKSYNTYVSDGDDEKSTNITRFIKEDLQLTADDAVVVKMDIEGAEWPILKRWLFDSEMANIIDELFVEIHYRHNTMLDYHWGQFSHSREEATRLIASLRAKGYFIHAWP